MVIKNHINKKETIILLTLTGIFIIIAIFVPLNYDHKYLVNALYTKTNFFKGQQNVFKWIDNIYDDKETAAFIKLILFNQKSLLIKDFKNDLIKINIIHLFTISGFHLNLIILAIKKIFKNKRFYWSNQIFFILFVLCYGYFLNYSISFLRIFITLLLSCFINPKKSFYLSGVINLFFFVNIGLNFGFLLSYGCVIMIYKVLELNINKVWQIILINFMCSLFTVWFQLILNKQINLLSILYSFLLNPIVIIIYLWYLLTFYISGLQSINTNFYLLIKYIIHSLSSLKTIIYYKKIFIYPVYISYIGYIYLWLFQYKTKTLYLKSV